MILRGDFASGMRLLGRLPQFVRRPVGLAEARMTLGHRLETRDTALLAVARRIYTQAENPYRVLLKAVGCEFGDLERLVARDGVEGALENLGDEELDGRPRLRLFIHPALGPVDPHEVTATFLEAISAGDGPGRVMGLAWRGAGLLGIERQPPLATGSGKILHLHVGRRPGATP